ncbi:hypothetical protein LCGC14_2623450, partial [marine sediment metagenome]
AEYGLKAIHLLMINLYGPDDNFDPKSSHVVPALIRKVAEAQKEGRDFVDGLTVNATFVEDLSLPEGKRVITRVKKPGVMKDGVLVRPAEVVVGVGEKPLVTPAPISQRISETLAERPVEPVRRGRVKLEEGTPKYIQTADELRQQGYSKDLTDFLLRKQADREAGFADAGSWTEAQLIKREGTVPRLIGSEGVTVYRAVPRGKGINVGDYVFLSKTGAVAFVKEHGLTRGQPEIVKISAPKHDFLIPDKGSPGEAIYAPTAPQRPVTPKVEAPVPREAKPEVKALPEPIKPVEKPVAERPVLKAPEPPKAEVKPPPVEPVKPFGDVVGLNKAENARLREFFKLDKLPELEKIPVKQSFAEAKTQQLDVKALDIADEVLKTKRPLTRAEHAGMGLRATKLVNEYDQSIKRQSELIDKGDVGAASTERLISETALEQFDKLTEAARFGRAEAARTMQIGT